MRISWLLCSDVFRTKLNGGMAHLAVAVSLYYTDCYAGSGHSWKKPLFGSLERLKILVTSYSRSPSNSVHSAHLVMSASLHKMLSWHVGLLPCRLFKHFVHIVYVKSGFWTFFGVCRAWCSWAWPFKSCSYKILDWCWLATNLLNNHNSAIFYSKLMTAK